MQTGKRPEEFTKNQKKQNSITEKNFIFKAASCHASRTPSFSVSLCGSLFCVTLSCVRHPSGLNRRMTGWTKCPSGWMTNRTDTLSHPSTYI
jgi:hypothetical protein